MEKYREKGEGKKIKEKWRKGERKNIGNEKKIKEKWRKWENMRMERGKRRKNNNKND